VIAEPSMDSSHRDSARIGHDSRPGSDAATCGRPQRRPARPTGAARRAGSPRGHRGSMSTITQKNMISGRMRTPHGAERRRPRQPAARVPPGVPSRRGRGAPPAISGPDPATRQFRRALRSAQHHDISNNLAVIASKTTRGRAGSPCAAARGARAGRGDGRRSRARSTAREVESSFFATYVLHDLFVSRRPRPE